MAIRTNASVYWQPYSPPRNLAHISHSGHHSLMRVLAATASRFSSITGSISNQRFGENCCARMVKESDPYENLRTMAAADQVALTGA